MGGKGTKRTSRREFAGGGSSFSEYGYGYGNGYHPPHCVVQSPYHAERHHYAPSPAHSYWSQSVSETKVQKRLRKKFSKIGDNYRSLDEVTSALAQAGLESSNLIVGIDFTKSNEWTGARSFQRRGLHHIGNGQNPYEQAISIIGRTLSSFDEDNLIPCFGFGDASTHDQDVFIFYQDDRFCNGFEEVLARYREIIPYLRLAGPTSFAPIIEMAISIVQQSGGQYHVLLIIADGQVTRSIDTEAGHPSPQEQRTIDAIVKASEYPLSIILVGVGDGPWDLMKEFDDNIPSRAFDNFQFVNFTEIMSKNINAARKEAAFALASLMEIPSQYKATLELGILGRTRANAPERIALPPPVHNAASFGSGSSRTYSSISFHQPNVASPGEYNTMSNRSSFSSPAYENQVCPVCLDNAKDMAFGCGHQTCCSCGDNLILCPICQSVIQIKIRLY